MTDDAATSNKPPTRRSNGLLSRLTLGAAAGAALVVSVPAHADPSETASRSYELGYTMAVKDGHFTVSRMRAMGFPDEAIVFSSQVDKVCAKELASVQSADGLDASDFSRGCANGLQSLVDAGVAS